MRYPAVDLHLHHADMGLPEIECGSRSILAADQRLFQYDLPGKERVTLHGQAAGTQVGRRRTQCERAVGVQATVGTVCKRCVAVDAEITHQVESLQLHVVG